MMIIISIFILLKQIHKHAHFDDDDGFGDKEKIHAGY